MSGFLGGRVVVRGLVVVEHLLELVHVDCY